MTTQRYADALELRQDVIDAGVSCPGDQQQEAPAEYAGTTYLACDQLTTMAVAGSDEQLNMMRDNLAGQEKVSVLVGPNWLVLVRDRATLERLHRELGGGTSAAP